ncbi:MAG: hypothetical protein JWM16_1108, partial [Verrucomicrobiales bacterium]|nr:hypothetical protein [Verrucomicrobiales bacterium]
LSTETNGMKVEGLETNYFSYTFARTAEGEAKLDLSTGYYGRRWVYTFNFSSPIMGTYVKEEFRTGRVKHRDFGAFQILSGITNAPVAGTNMPPAGTNAIPTAPPASLAGLAYIFQTGETPDRLEFLTATNGVEFEDNVRTGDDNPDKFVTYSYNLTASNTAALVVYRGSDRDEYTLTFTQGAQGTFIRREYRSGALHDTDIGAFSPSSVSLQPPVGNPGGSGTNAVPPSALTGQAYNVLSGITPDRLEFSTATSGLLYGDNTAPNSFTYTYAITGANTASVVVRVKVDRWDEYDWTFTADGAGTFVRREFRNSVLNDTDTGTFSRVAGN